jgi:N-acetylglucosaminyl-diphospho-decaprenol L-rhamnosyltransferase
MTPGVPAPVVIAVVSWNTRDLLERCLRSMEPEVSAGRADVWVVDNASEDGSAELVNDAFGWANLVASQRNLGFGPAVNLVAQRAGGAWIAPANSDIELEPGALERLLRTGDEDPAAGAIAPRLILPDGTTQHSVYPFPTLPFAAAFNLGLHRAVPGLADRLCVPGSWNPDRPRRVDWAIGAFLVVRRAAWDAAGGFDAAQWMYAEDLDLGWRLSRAGWPTRYEPRARVRHAESAAVAQAWGPGQRERWMLSTYAWMLRRRGRARTRAFAGAHVAGAKVRRALLWPAARARPARLGPKREELHDWARLHREAGFASRARLSAHR